MSKETINYTLDTLTGLGSAAATEAILTTALGAIGGSLLVAMEAGTAGAATIIAGEFLTVYVGFVATAVSLIMGYYNAKTHKFNYKGGDIKIGNFSSPLLPNKKIRL